MKMFSLKVFILTSLIVSGCASTMPRLENVMLDNTKIEKGIHISATTVIDGQYAAHRIPADIYDKALSAAVKNANPTAQRGEELTVYFLSSGKPVIGRVVPNPYLAAALSIWKLNQTDGDQLFINYSTVSTGVSDAFVGVTRMRMASERALKKNIEDGLQVCSIPLSKRVPAMEKSLVVMVPEQDDVYEIAITNLGTKRIHQLFRTNGIFQTALPPGEYELSRLAHGGNFVWSNIRVAHTLRFKIGTMGVYILDAEMLITENDELLSLKKSLTGIHPSLAPRTIQLTPSH